MCSLFERPGTPVAYITDAPTYAGFLSRAGLCQHARIYSVEMDEEGPLVERMRAQIRAARAAGYDVPFYYTVPDGHNPAGFSFTQERRKEILGEARFIRAFMYFQAVQLWGDVPLQLKEVRTISAELLPELYPLLFPARSPQDSVYMQIVMHLEVAHAASGSSSGPSRS